MADTRCPMCGKPNKEGAETCAFCGARLKPLIGSNQGSQTPGKSEDPADWLSGLRGDSSSQGAQDDSASEQDAAPADVPDWLSRIRGKQEDETPAGDDWLQGLAPSSSESEDDTPDWLKPAGSEPSASGPAAETGSDWLHNLQAGSAPQPPEQPENWMDEFNSNPASGQPEPQAGEANSWLDSLRSEGVEQPDTASQPEADLPAETNDWLNQLSQDAPAAEPPSASGTSDSSDQAWLNGLADWSIPSQDSAAAPETPAPAPTGSGDLSDWLSQLDAASPAEETPQPQNDAGLDWMNDTPVVPPQRMQSDGLPDWTPPQPGEIQPHHIPDEKPGMPDWLSSFQGDEPQPASSETPASADPVMPWDMPSASSETPAAPPSPEEAQHTGLTDWLSALPAEDSQSPAAANPLMPWDMPPADSSPFTAVPEPADSSAEPPLAPAETPDWLKAFSAELPATSEPQNELPADLPGAGQGLPHTPGDLPDWLNGADDNENIPAAETPAETEAPADAAPAGDSLEKANLPSWLQAMRPVEAVVPQGTPPAEGKTTIEKSGLLAGMVNALPGQELVTRTRKPPAYSARLQASEKQRQYADMIESMLSEEHHAQAARPERSHTPERIVRLIIALALVVLLAFPIVAGTHIMPLPTLGLQTTIQFGKILGQMPEGAPVLLAVDYEPGLSGELTLAGTPVINHLAARKANLVVMSTVPTGPVLAENLLKTARANGLQVENLGFLPGGTAGLQEFASLPKLTMPYTLNGENAWTVPGVMGDTLSTFAAVVVMTDNAETARSWIEQVQPSLGKTPLLFVVSAQAAPILQPYIDSNQVQGMVSGLAGGSTYEQITGTPGAAQSYWDAYQFGLFAAMILVLFGGLAALFGNIFRRPASKRRA